jgi:hypothetical protein
VAVAVLTWQHFRPHDPAKLFANRVEISETTEE